MSKISSTTWEKDKHTDAKHEILENHLKAWFPILSGIFGRVVYLDGFAGPGIYKNNEEGSPIIAIRTAEEHIFNKKFGEIIFIFIEKDTDRADRLKQEIKKKFPKLNPKIQYFVHQGEFAPTITKVLDSLEEDGSKLAPTFAFIDPFGYKQFPMETVARLMAHEHCEVLITFMIDFVNRFADQQKDAIDELFGDNSWRSKKIPTKPKERQKFFLDMYEGQLKKNAKVKYTRTFQMVRDDGHTAYYLVFGTNHPKGMAVMKDAMYKADERGTFRFSDREDPNQMFLSSFTTEESWISDAAKQVYEAFKGKKILADTVKNYVTTETRFRYKAKILEELEKQDLPKIKVDGRKQKGFSYPKGSIIEFLI